MRDAKRLKRINKNLGLIQLKEMSRYDIKNALTKKYMPLSDNIHGPYCMMPPELLHTSGSGLILYMFESLQWQIGGGKIRDDIDKLHIRVYMSTKRQSECDFPRGAIRNGIIVGTKCQLEERKGNLFLLLCIANTTEGSMKLQVQSVLLYGSETWNLTETVLARLEGFHIRAAYRMARKHKPCKGLFGNWIYEFNANYETGPNRHPLLLHTSIVL